MDYVREIANRLHLQFKQVENTLKLLQQGATVPFVARYRKEQTGELDELKIISIQDLWKQFQELEKRREFILITIEKLEKLTPQLRKKIENATELSELEDLYLPYKPKKTTRASKAMTQGLEPLANQLQKQQPVPNPNDLALQFVNPERGIHSVQDALQGAKDILAERFNENVALRNFLRQQFQRTAYLYAEPKRGVDTKEKNTYSNWYHWKEKISNIPGHRVLAIFRGENENILSVKIRPDNEPKLIENLQLHYINKCNASATLVSEALEDAYKRLLAPGIENEFRSQMKKQADKTAVDIFSQNLRQLIMAPPLGQKAVIAIDPGFRTGCKTVVLDEQGDPMEYETLYFHSSVNDEKQAIEQLENWAELYEVDAIAIGNGTAGRETEMSVKKAKFYKDIPIVMVNESGASIYSVGEVAREEFPDYDITVRGAISIGRRLMDPLAEFVKIDPKALGVGQYQHDVDQTLLKQQLDQVVESCVNQVGVQVNTASKELLRYVSGIGPKLAKLIVDHRKQNGAFSSREELKKVPQLGNVTFEQCAGFLRIEHAENPLDNSAVHPERYSLVRTMAQQQNATVKDLMADPELRKRINLQDFISEDCGLPTLKDIMNELEKPGRDPRDRFEAPNFNKDIRKIEDLYPELVLQGIVTNITAFGAFVDIGVHQDALLHVSQIANRFIKDPAKVLKLHQKVKVKVLEVDLQRKRISVSMKNIDQNIE